VKALSPRMRDFMAYSVRRMRIAVGFFIGGGW